ncbi:hypothetical protein BWD42_07505 [Sphingobacterium sp. CZ-UAM]|uniref:porin family protein n=1 Tax=Sphingobacterium sp. CZ-UAM TaxID=1933868 RepID=UPI0009850943|nr:porin family protein [Sphingobacterium sp. CZ-UAM]OOG19739.1 hypothetical protein BWD42_07505 [Sphingobacterium sp. CZ-UAM]
MKNNSWTITAAFIRILTGYAIVLGFPQSTIAQLQVGLQVGIDQNYLALKNKTVRDFTYYEEKNGYMAGLMLRYSLNRYLSLGVEPAWITKNYQLKRRGYYSGVFQATENTYLQLPLVFNTSVSYRRFVLGLTAGGYTAFWLRSKNKGKIPNISDLSAQPDGFEQVFEDMQAFRYEENYQLSSKRDRRHEWGLLLGLDLHYQFAPSLAVFVAPRYYYALTGQVRHYAAGLEQRFNETSAISAGLVLNIHPTRK